MRQTCYKTSKLGFILSKSERIQNFCYCVQQNIHAFLEVNSRHTQQNIHAFLEVNSSLSNKYTDPDLCVKKQILDPKHNKIQFNPRPRIRHQYVG